MRLPRIAAFRVLAALLAALPLRLHAQEPTEPALPDSIQEMLMEFQGLQERFQDAQQQALRDDDGLRGQQEQLRELVNATLLRMYPHLEQSMELLPRLHDEAVAAEQAGDTERLEAIVAEGRQIQMELEDAQTTVVEQPEVAREIDAFQGRMIEGMKKIDPGIEAVMARMQAIAARLSEWLG